MKTKRNILTLLFLLLVLQVTFYEIRLLDSSFICNENPQKIKLRNLHPYSFEFITVEKDSDFLTLGFPGSGSIEDPYLAL